MSMQDKSTKTVSVILPIYNEEKIIENAVEITYKSLERDFIDFELILIDDGSKDKSSEIMIKLQKNFPKIKLIPNYINLNQGVSIQRGLAISQFDYIIHNGIDLPFNPTSLKVIVEEMGEYDLFVLERNIYAGATLWRKIVSKLNITLRKLLFPKLTNDIVDINFM